MRCVCDCVRTSTAGPSGELLPLWREDMSAAIYSLTAMSRPRFIREVYKYPRRDDNTDTYDFYLNFPAVRGSTLLENEDWHYPFWPTAAIYCLDSPHFHIEDIWHLHPYAKVPPFV